ncbi:TetR/AcrR family transcriptional regulator [Dyadobacter sp. CY345]|uniref:TetR/AcrR family transcriptional regulator n=1 Tax=Dyadobacter sp. CY345 TaxID=2909335 RepID=UPI001F28F7DC|nr:TetR/AcrR family transcriptional regulator [Dyadobacter sp. CY345]MCF2443772.1 TetR/AcrR family transcriptional regulator [Dyadobacter sp. CY345]
MKARTDTKEKIMELGTDLVESIGYPSLSYQQISSQLGIKNAAVHYHFPSKESLGLEILNTAIGSFEKMISNISSLGLWEQLDTFFKSYRKHLESNNKICLIGASASDYQELPESMQAAASEYLVLVKGWFVELLREGREEGVFHFKGEPKHKAAVIVSALAGGLQHARLVGNLHYDEIVEQLVEDLKP